MSVQSQNGSALPWESPELASAELTQALLYFDPNPATSRPTQAGLEVAGYRVIHTGSEAEVEAQLSAATSAGERIGLFVIDACTAPEIAGVLTTRLRRMDPSATIIVVTRRDNPTPFPGIDGFAALRRPFATPALIRLLEYRNQTTTSGGSVAGRSLGDDRNDTVLTSVTAPRLGDYELLLELGRGGMGSVFLCRRSGERGFRRLFALKQLHRHLLDEPEFTDMLVDEAKLASLLHHPNVVSVLDFKRSDAGYYLVMDYVEGVNLAQLLRRAQHQRPPALLVPLLINTLDGLHAAHTLTDDRGESLHLVHRDVSPQNVLVGVDGIGRLTDFGIVKARSRITTTRAGVRKGKIGYVAPELLLNPDVVDPRTDLWSVGVMMWSVLTSRRLFQADNEVAGMGGVLEQRIPPPSEVNPESPRCLDAICLKALSRDPSQRYASALEMADHLREVAAREGLLASPSKIGEWVIRLFGREISNRRQAVRVAATTPDEANTGMTDHFTPTLHGVSAVSARTPAREPTSKGEPPRWMWLVVGALGTLALGAAAFALRASDQEPTATVASEQQGPTPPTSANSSPPAARRDPVVAADAAPCPDGMALIRGGKFFMGTDAESPVLQSARPAHQVEVGDYCLDRTEVTVEAYRACSTAGDCKRAYRDTWWPKGSASEADWKRDRELNGQMCNENYDDRGAHPVNCVTWHQAKAYCERGGKRLPSEAEWEYAARRSDGRVYPWGDERPDSERMNGCGAECTAWREKVGLSKAPRLYEADDGYPGTAPVGSFPAGRTQADVHDMAGNVFEWTEDAFRPYGEVEKLAQAEAAGRVIRGGAHNSFMPEFAEPALRFAMTADAHTHGIGFRCAAKPKG